MSQQPAVRTITSHPNLKPFPKGRSGNPGGRPRGSLVEPLLAELERVANKRTGETAGQLIAKRLVSMALKGNLKAIVTLLAYVDGKPVQTVQQQGDGRVTVRVAWDGEDEVSGGW